MAEMEDLKAAQSQMQPEPACEQAATEGAGRSAAFTPGPLMVSAIRRTMDGQQWLRIVTERDNREVAYVPFGDRTAQEYRQCRADARLYAAAPDLLAAAKPLVAEISEYPPSAGEDDDEVVEVRLGDLKALRRAIAKALGASA